MRVCRLPLIVVFVIAAAMVFWTQGPAWPLREPVFHAFGLSRESLAAGAWWTYLTHAFLHGSWWHGLFNLAGLWVLGKHLCDQHGGIFFTAAYFAGVVAGGLAQTALVPDGILVGASGGVFALVVAAGFLWDDRVVALRLGPVRFAVFRGRHLGWGVLIAALLGVLFAPLLPDRGASIGHACHAGAALAGAVVAWLGLLVARPAPALVLP